MAAEPVTLSGGAIGEHGEVARRFVKPGKLELRIKAGARAALRRQRLAVAGRKILPDAGANGFVLDDHKTPWLAQPDRRREARKLDQRFQRAVRQWIGPEPAHVAPPDQKLTQARPKR